MSLLLPPPPFINSFIYFKAIHILEISWAKLKRTVSYEGHVKFWLFRIKIFLSFDYRSRYMQLYFNAYELYKNGRTRNYFQHTYKYILQGLIIPQPSCIYIQEIIFDGFHVVPRGFRWFLLVILGYPQLSLVILSYPWLSFVILGYIRFQYIWNRLRSYYFSCHLQKSSAVAAR